MLHNNPLYSTMENRYNTIILNRTVEITQSRGLTMPALKNISKEKFVQKWHELDNKSEAYRIAYPKSRKWKIQSINPKSSVLSREPEIVARFKELQEAATDDHNITIKSLLKELNEVKAKAMDLETPQCSAAVSCVMSKAKLVGLDVVKIQVEAKEELTPWGSITVEVDSVNNDSEDE